MQRKTTVLVVDDDRHVRRVVVAYMTRMGLEVCTAQNGAEALKELCSRKPDVVLLDVMMPDMDGWAVLQRVREMTDTPVIMLTARDSEVERLKGFELGADDYVSKPFSLAELAARVRALVKRSATKANGHDNGFRSPYAVGDLVVDFAAHRVLKRGRPVKITPTAYRLLEVLAEHPGQTLSVDQLLDQVWGTGQCGDPAHVKRYVWHLRQEIEDDPSDPHYVQSVRGLGYRLANGAPCGSSGQLPTAA